MGLEAYPLTPLGLRVMGTMLKIGRYRSAALYFSAAKQEHISQGHPWSDQLDMGVKEAIRSCVRGLGPDKKCPAFDLAKVCELPDLEPCVRGPRFPKETVILFSYFACREIEASLRTRADVQITPGKGCGVVSLWLPASKTDPKGNGVLRRHGCTCEAHPQRCPVKAAQRIYDHGATMGSSETDPFLTTLVKGEAPTKLSMVETFRQVAKALEWKEAEIKALTGHVLRATGAQYLARCGIEYYKIQLFCRWGSDTVLRYLRDAPLEDSQEWVPESLKKASVTEVLMKTSINLNKDKETLQFQGKDVDRIVMEALESRSAEVMDTLNTKVDEVQALIESLKEKKIAMDDHWALELSRRFLPKYVVNLSSQKIHVVRDATHTACGFEWRNSKDHVLKNEVDNDVVRCEKPACQKAFQRLQE